MAKVSARRKWRRAERLKQQAAADPEAAERTLTQRVVAWKKELEFRANALRDDNGASVPSAGALLRDIVTELTQCGAPELASLMAAETASLVARAMDSRMDRLVAAYDRRA